MAFSINEFMSNGLIHGGARPTLFKIELTPPNDSSLTKAITFHARATSTPAFMVNKVEVPYMGRKIPKVGDRVIGDWDITVMNDEDFAVRNVFEAWSNALNTLESNLLYPQAFAGSLNKDYTADGVITQYSKDGSEIRKYQMFAAFPMAVSAMPLDWSATDQFQEFDVRFAFAYFGPVPTISAGGGGTAATYGSDTYNISLGSRNTTTETTFT